MPIGSKIAYGLGQGPASIMDKGLSALAFPVFNVIFGMNPAVVGAILGVLRIFDAFTDPLAGNVSDNLRTRWGRRKPCMVAGTVLASALFFCLWLLPKDAGPRAAEIYVFSFCILSFTALSFHAVPYGAIGYALSPDHRERSRVFVYRSFIIKIFNIAASWTYLLIQSDLFSTVHVGVRVTGALMSVGVLLFGLAPALFVQERGYDKIKRQAKIKFLQGVKAVAQSRAAVLLLGCFISIKAVSELAGSLEFYALAYYVCQGDLKEAGAIFGMLNTGQFVAAMATLPIISYLVRKVDKKVIVYIGIALGLLASASRWWLYTPDFPYLAIVPHVFIGFGISVAYTLMPSMMADAIDEDELKCGLRREGTFSSVWEWAFKASTGLATLSSGLVITLIGFDESLGGNQSPSTLLWFRIVIVAAPLLLYALAIVFIYSYPLNGKAMADIKTQLEDRRGKL